MTVAGFTGEGWGGKATPTFPVFPNETVIPNEVKRNEESLCPVIYSLCPNLCVHSRNEKSL